MVLAGMSCITLKRQTDSYTEKIRNLNIDMIMVKGGAFMMGCNAKKRDCRDDELPLHDVVLSDFYISKYEITYAQYDLFCENTNRKKLHDFGWGRGNRPVVFVSWYDAKAFCKWLSEISGENYRLPTEAEWEYAAKGGNKNKGFIYAGSDNANKVAWYLPANHPRPDSLTYMKTQLVGNKKPNKLGLYDMSGNAWEWCDDGYSKNFYKESPTNNPRNKSLARVARGGGWKNELSYCLITNRDFDSPKMKDYDLGFRIAKEIQPKME